MRARILNKSTCQTNNYSEVPDGEESDWASRKSQAFIWVDISTRNSKRKMLNKEVAQKIRIFGKLRKAKFGESWLTPRRLT
jgi:hypothetical protein